MFELRFPIRLPVLTAVTDGLEEAYMIALRRVRLQLDGVTPVTESRAAPSLPIAASLLTSKLATVPFVAMARELLMAPLPRAVSMRTLSTLSDPGANILLDESAVSPALVGVLVAVYTTPPALGPASFYLCPTDEPAPSSDGNIPVPKAAGALPGMVSPFLTPIEETSLIILVSDIPTAIPPEMLFVAVARAADPSHLMSLLLLLRLAIALEVLIMVTDPLVTL